MSRIVCFTGSKGGSGKTFCALNAALCLTHEMRKRVLYVDANFPVSNQVSEFFNEIVVSEYLDKHFVSEELEFKMSRLHDVDFQGCFSGRQIDFDAFDENHIKKISASIVKKSIDYDYVIIDLGSAFLEQHKLFLDICSDIVVVVKDNVSGVTRLVNDIDYLRLQNYSSSIFRIMINEWQADSAINEDWLSARFGFSAHGFIPECHDQTAQFPFIDGAKKTKKNAGIFDALIKFCASLDATQVEHKNIQTLIQSLDDESSKNENAKKKEKLKTLKIIIQEEILKIIDLKHLEIAAQLSDKDKLELESKVESHAVKILDSRTDITDRRERDDIISSVIDGVLYLGPLMPLLKDDDISEIMVNDAKTIYVEKKGKLMLSGVEFLSEKQQLRIIDRIVAPIGRRIDVSSPMVDARLLDGSRVNIIIPPLAPKGSIITIRKFETDPLGIDDLVGFDTINQQMVVFLKAVVKSRLNIVVSGGTGSGKTTLLNILSSYIPDDERVITVEDSAELQLKQNHVLTLEARPPNIENKGEVTIRDLVRNALRMRPERIVVGECRAGEALSLIHI